METIVYGLIFVLGAVYVVMAMGVTRLISRSDYFDPRQKLFQYLIVRLVPIVGAAFVVTVLGPDIPRRRRPGIISLAEAIILSAFGATLHDAVGKTFDAGADDLQWIFGADYSRNHTNRGPCECSTTARALFERVRHGRYLVL